MTKKDDNEKIAKKLEEMGVMPSDKKTEEATATTTEDNTSSSKLPLALIGTFALFIGGIIFIVFGSSIGAGSDDDSASLDTADNANALATTASTGAPSAQNIAANSRQNSFENMQAERRKAMEERRKAYQKNFNRAALRTPPEQPEWVKEQQALMEKQMNQRADLTAQNMNMSPSEPPAWVKEQQALMQKQMNQRPESSAPNMNMSPPEPPAWVKEQQALAQKQMNQRPQWANQNMNMAPPEPPAWVKQQQQQMMAYQQRRYAQPQPQWNNNPQNFAPHPRAPVYYNQAPGYGYYPPAPYMGPRY